MAELLVIPLVAEFVSTMTIKKLPKFVLGVMLLGVTASAFPLSLGRMRGTAIVGRAFDVTLLARLGSGEQLSDICITNDIFFGDNLISPASVTTDVRGGANTGDVLIRVRTSLAVNEPVVTVNVREGCPQKNSRKYVFLAEALTGKEGDLAMGRGEVIGSAPVQLPAVAAFANTPRQGVAPVAAAPSAIRSPSTTKQIRDGASATKPSTDQLVGMSARVAAKAALASTSKPSRSRLKLDHLELGPERDPVLRASSEMLTLPSADPQQRVNAAALWQALNAQPQDMLRDSERVQTLEKDVAKMLTQSRATELALNDVRAQLTQSRTERFSNWLVYTLGALLLLSWLISAYLVTRRRDNEVENASPWWRKGPGANEGENLDLSAELGSVASARVETGRFAAGFAREHAAPVFEMSGGSNNMSPADRFKTIAPLAEKDRVEFSISLPSMTGMPRIVNAEELFDVQQQSDFFVSLGDFDKAIDVLRHHIADNVETSAVAYLDLFHMYHQLGRQTDYEALSDDFSRTFNAQIPAFDRYKTATQGLEAYDDAIERIVALWPTREVLEVLEESIFRKPDSKSAVFSLAAYRDLLLLHAIAKKVVERPGARATSSRDTLDETTPAAYAHTSTQAVSVHLENLPKLHAYKPDEQKIDPTRPPASGRLGLDIDLNFDFTDPPGNVPLASSRDREEPASFTHELLDFEVFPDDYKPR